MRIEAKIGQFSHCSWKCLLGARPLRQWAQLRPPPAFPTLSRANPHAVMGDVGTRALRERC